MEFLGDAVLITFDADASATSRNAERHRMDILERAVLCCLHIMLRYPHVELDMQSPALARERTRKRKDSFSSDFVVSIAAMKAGSRLSLHVAVTVGAIDHVIVGAPNERMDYFIDGECMSSLKSVCHSNAANIKPRSSETDVTFAAEQLELLYDSMLSAAGLSRTSTVRKAITSRQALEDTDYAAEVITAYGGNAAAAPVTGIEAMDRVLEKFVNQSFMHKLKQRKAVSADGATAANDLRSDVKGEFRTISAVFVKIYNQSGAQTSQSIMTTLIQCLKKNGGVFQQYAGALKHSSSSLVLTNWRSVVDDKGHTMFYLYGLPPHTTGQDALNALRASVEFATAIAKSNLGPVAVAVATGDVLFTSFGSSYRIDASFLGDVINIAARLLTVAHLANPGDVLCESETRSAAHGLTFTELGEHMVKGKAVPIAVYGVNADSFKLYDQINERANLKLVGYHEERAVLDDAFVDWLHRDTGRSCVVEGASGMGKSMMLKYMKEMANESFVKCCVVQGTEMEKYSPYSSIGAVIAYIFSQFSATSTSNRMNRQESQHSKAPSRLSVHQRSARQISMAQISRGRLNEPDIYEFLRIYDVYSEFAPLLKMALPWLNIADNDSTRSLSSKTKKDLLEPMLIKILSGFLKTTKVVVIFDDAQWLDTLSLEVLQHLNASRSKGLFLLFTRQITGIPKLESLVALPSTTKLTLQGLTKEDVAELTLQFFKEEGAVAVDEELKSVIYNGGCQDDLKDLQLAIATNDMYHYLVYDDTDEDNDDYAYAFRSTAIKDVIYERQSFADRSALHEQAAVVYESNYNENKLEFLLPIVLFHYSRSDNTVKYADCLEEMGGLYLDTFSNTDAIEALSTLIDLNNNETKPVAENQRLALWHSMRATAYAQMILIPPAQEDLLLAMRLLNVYWPEEGGQTVALCKAMLTQLFLED
ncbi:Adenylate cyclase type 10 [Irineochytrium annulatum]|nr:Adenylate cyclase type 10 [Irineochytrium annulatum]